MANILIVDDDTLVADMLELRLSIRGHVVHKASNGRQGAEHALTFKPDLILMDMQMPVMGGEEAVRHLRKEGYQGLIASLSAAAMSQEIKKALDSGCNAAFIKPIGADFEDRVEHLLEALDG